MTELLKLADRCTSAAGPDHALDLAIVRALYPDIGPYQPQCQGDEPIFWHDPYRKQPCPMFTASIDAALTLKPEAANCYGFENEVGMIEAYYSLNNVKDGHWYRSAYAATAPLALCAAALRARHLLAPVSGSSTRAAASQPADSGGVQPDGSK